MALALALPSALTLQPAAQALSFRFDFAGNPSDEFQTATREAADLWSSVLKDDVTIDLRIEYSDLSSIGSVLGGAQPGKIQVDYDRYVAALLQDSVSGNDFLALNNLQLSSQDHELVQEFQAGAFSSKKGEIKLNSDKFAFLMDGQFSRSPNSGSSNSDPNSQADFIDRNGNSNNRTVLLTNAQARALGLADTQQKGLDSIIKINSGIGWDLNRKDGVDSDKYDLSSVLQHEIGHALGVTSGVDALDFLASATGPVDIEENSFSYLTPLDFYRYSEKSAGLGVMDLTLGGDEKYFSLDGGQSAVTNAQGQKAYFSTGSLRLGGDGSQGSHWKANSTNPLGVMNPILNKGQSINISELDAALLDSVGWNLDNASDKRAVALGIDWVGFTSNLARDRQAVKDSLIAQWGNDIPALEAALGEASSKIEGEFRQKLEKEFDKVADKLEGKGGKGGKGGKEIDDFYKSVAEAANKRNEELRKLPEKIYKKDLEIRKWLTLPTDELAQKIEKADGESINRLANIVKASSPAERSLLEPKLEAALAQFAERPNKLVDQLLNSSGPANPIGWNIATRWWWWWQQAGAEEGYDAAVADGFVYAATAAPEDMQAVLFMTTSAIAKPSTEIATGVPTSEGLAPINSSILNASKFNGVINSAETKDVPEPSSVLALFGIAAIGAGLTRKREPA
jgi:hypothetical protein